MTRPVAGRHPLCLGLHLVRLHRLECRVVPGGRDRRRLATAPAGDPDRERVWSWSCTWRSTWSTPWPCRRARSAHWPAAGKPARGRRDRAARGAPPLWRELGRPALDRRRPDPALDPQRLPPDRPEGHLRDGPGPASSRRIFGRLSPQNRDARGGHDTPGGLGAWCCSGPDPSSRSCSMPGSGSRWRRCCRSAPSTC